MDQLIKALSKSLARGEISEVNFSDFSGKTENHEETIEKFQEIWSLFQGYFSQIQAIADCEHYDTITPSGDDDQISHSILSIKNQIFDKSRSLEELFLRFQGIVDTLPDALFSINEKGKILSCNKAAKDILGYEEKELLGNNINMIMPDPYHSKHDDYLKSYKKTGQKSIIGNRREVIARRKDGSTFPVLLAVGELKTKDGPVFTGIIQDISKQKVAEDEIKKRNAILEEKSWIEGHIANILKIAQSSNDLMSMTQSVLSEMAKFIEIGQGTFYIREEGGKSLYKDTLRLYGSYAFKHRKIASPLIQFGEGLVGQCAFEKQPIILSNVPKEYSQIGSSLGEGTPLTVFVQPILFEDEILGVLELLSFKNFTEKELSLIEQISTSLGTVINTIIGKTRTEKLLENSEILSQELREQQQITEGANEELKKNTNRLEESEKALKSQQEELKVANEELEEKSGRMEHQKKKIETSYAELEAAKKDIEKKSEEIETSSKYKSQFLSNMSHELRTPLNSLLLLSNKLQENDENNLTADQVEMAECIHSGGKDLLYLINDILDLSKVEAGMLTVEKESIDLELFIQNVSKKFKHTAQDKGLEFKVEVEPGAHNHIIADTFRLEQVIKNLLSNAFKFTSKGSVSLRVHHPGGQEGFENTDLNAQNCMAVSVTDTGIGIPESKQADIFEAFKQADGSTSRQFGGTGLGLSITVELLKLMGGEIQVQSRENEGSTFICYLPIDFNQTVRVSNNDRETSSSPDFKKKVINTPVEKRTESPQSFDTHEGAPIDDNILKGRNILVVDDDLRNTLALTTILKKYGLDITIADNGELALQKLAENENIEVVLMDIMMPVMDGYEAIEAIRTGGTKHRDVPIIALTASTMPETKTKSLSLGANDFLTKPVDLNLLLPVMKLWLNQA